MRFILVNNIPSVLLMSLVLLASAQRTSNNLRDADVHELARQNKITKQILEAFIQKKLGLSKGHVRPPSIHDIIPMNMMAEKHEHVRNISQEEEQATETQEFPEDDSLQSVESEQIDSIYSEGRSKKYNPPPFEQELDSYRKTLVQF